MMSVTESREIATTTTHDGALTIDPAQTWWTEGQIEALNSIGLRDTPRGDAIAYLHLCQATGLDPFRREIYLIGRKDSSEPSGKKWTAQTGIDGYRHLAERTGLYGGKLMTEWCGPDGQWRDVWLSTEPPAAARVTVKRTDIDHPIFGVALYAEFCPMLDVYAGPQGNRKKTGEQKPPAMWEKMPSHMLAKCAEALALRTAFPRQLSGLHTADEMGRADADARNAELAEAAGRRAREQARLEGASRPWAAGEGVILGPNGEVLSDGSEHGEVRELNRDALWHELGEQARVLGKTITAHTSRWVAAHRKNADEATAEELYDLVESRRDQVTRHLAEHPDIDPPAPYATEPEAAASTDPSNGPDGDPAASPEQPPTPDAEPVTPPLDSNVKGVRSQLGDYAPEDYAARRASRTPYLDVLGVLQPSEEADLFRRCAAIDRAEAEAVGPHDDLYAELIDSAMLWDADAEQAEASIEVDGQTGLFDPKA